MLGTRGGSYERAAVAHSRMSFDPLFASPFHMTREFVTQMVRRNVFWPLKEQLFAAKDGEASVPLPDGLLFMNRLQFGFYSVLARLDATVDYRSVEEAFCRQAGLPELVG